MKKIFSIIICLVLILMISLLNIHNKKDEDKSLTKIKVAYTAITSRTYMS